ncbi:MAG: universal stress protein [Sedimentisphaerales bacterium]
MLKLKRILYPTDFSQYSLTALPFAVGLAQQNNAQLFCLHVVELPREEYLRGDYMVPLNVPHVPEDKVLRTARARMERFVTEHLFEMDKVTSRVLVGVPFAEIIRYARDQSIDLIVMGTHGHTGLAAMLLGSVAEKVVRKAPCAVLTVRDPQYKFEAP